MMKVSNHNQYFQDNYTSIKQNNKDVKSVSISDLQMKQELFYLTIETQIPKVSHKLVKIEKKWIFKPNFQDCKTQVGFGIPNTVEFCCLIILFIYNSDKYLAFIALETWF